MNARALRWRRAALRVQFSFLIFAHLCRKAGFNPDQPGDEQGRWTDEGGSKRPDGREPLPHIPLERPLSTQLRNQIVKQLAKWALKVALAETILGPFVGTALIMADLVQAADWLKEYAPLIQSYLDPPKSLDELREGALARRPGYDVHHIVEQTPAEKFGIPRSMIDAPENLVSVPRFKHQEISDWYSTRNEKFGNFTPRKYLSDKDWNTRAAMGLDALKEVGVLKP
jgi:hypothetical protein